MNLSCEKVKGTYYQTADKLKGKKMGTRNNTLFKMEIHAKKLQGKLSYLNSIINT